MFAAGTVLTAAFVCRQASRVASARGQSPITPWQGRPPSNNRSSCEGPVAHSASTCEPSKAP